MQFLRGNTLLSAVIHILSGNLLAMSIFTNSKRQLVRNCDTFRRKGKLSVIGKKIKVEENGGNGSGGNILKSVGNF